MWRNRLRERDGQIGKASVAVHVDRRIVSAVNNIPDKTLATKPSLGSERRKCGISLGLYGVTICPEATKFARTPAIRGTAKVGVSATSYVPGFVSQFTEGCSS